METLEVTYNNDDTTVGGNEEYPSTLVDAPQQDISQDDYQLMNMIRNLRQSAEDDVATKLQAMEARVKELENSLLQANERLEPLLIFEPILQKPINEPLSVSLFGFSEDDVQKLYVIAYDNYKNLRIAHEENPRKKNPLNQMLSDYIASKLNGNVNECKLAREMKGNKNYGIIINDK